MLQEGFAVFTEPGVVTEKVFREDLLSHQLTDLIVQLFNLDIQHVEIDLTIGRHCGNQQVDYYYFVVICSADYLSHRYFLAPAAHGALRCTPGRGAGWFEINDLEQQPGSEPDCWSSSLSKEGPRGGHCYSRRRIVPSPSGVRWE
ncbi:hypothetical protein CSC28_6567 (plasmid) [Pseudomonas paraeruginosa]|nr:hypothetical protein CSC28_6567 [Pseudomonas paraeruginosa]